MQCKKQHAAQRKEGQQEEGTQYEPINYILKKILKKIIIWK